MNFNLVYLFQAAGILVPSMEAGAVLSISAQSIPVLLSAPADVGLAQFKYVYLLGKRTLPFIAAGNMLIQGCLAYWERPRSVLSSNLYLISGSLSVLIPLYSVVFMGNTNGSLLAINPDIVLKSKEATDTFRKLLQKWSIMSLVRSALLCGSALSSFAGTFLF
ncbi:mitochondrial DUF1772 family protein, multimembrane spanning anthrone oxygenase-like [Schizosaccharomyces osmophilus]|uniref:Mitochondrial DUF1772 family protein, multimembrane spanning anthrone oxygenase-like n=1 Tax=Schizosaccharomyces osmophilus TaxID=2545709 RepID=A0AAE9WC01_9SCHI|nr:mitochondrial DUF1772 family protein, multimembrane spanning anthrone oxygenase-like [Schizosaccharomyces osmophilus]WBW73045.1 mitochondrial DUF1772 family protein, multimembrane spanning anthrone oxygenase-like [Schizosaccharomyces osmophilus]